MSPRLKGIAVMVALTHEELREVRLAVAARVRSASHTSRHGVVCAEVLKKLAEAERKNDPAHEGNGPHLRNGEVDRG